MASVRKRVWNRPDGTKGQAWQLSYYDADGHRQRLQFATKAEADDARVRVEGEISTGTHVPDAKSLTVINACQAWLDHLERLVQKGKRERCTLSQYRGHVNNHIRPHRIARVRLSRLRAADCQVFVDDLAVSVSHAMARKIRATLRNMIGYAARVGWIGTNPMRDTRLEQLKREDDDVQIPTKEEVRKILQAAEKLVSVDKGRTAALVMLGFLCGPRPSELLAVERFAISLGGNAPFLRISQRIDNRAKIGLPKRQASHRDIPIGPSLVAALKRWYAGGLSPQPVGKQIERNGKERELRMVFPSEAGTPISYFNFYNRIWAPLLTAAGVTIESAPEKEGEPPKIEPRYAPNVMRHFAASLWIDQKVEPKLLQQWMGHASIKQTLDTYGHLWRNRQSEVDMAALAEADLLLGQSENKSP